MVLIVLSGYIIRRSGILCFGYLEDRVCSHCQTMGPLVMDEPVDFENHRLKLKTSGELRIVLGEPMEYTSIM